MLIKKTARRREPVRHPNGPMKEVILASGAVPQVTQVAVATFDAASEIAMHTHPTMWELYFVLDGAAVYTVGEERHLAEPGDLIAVPAGTPHGVRVIGAPHRIFYWGIATGPMPSPHAQPPPEPARQSTDT